MWVARESLEETCERAVKRKRKMRREREEKKRISERDERKRRERWKTRERGKKMKSANLKLPCFFADLFSKKILTSVRFVCNFVFLLLKCDFEPINTYNCTHCRPVGNPATRKILTTMVDGISGVNFKWCGGPVLQDIFHTQDGPVIRMSTVRQDCLPSLYRSIHRVEVLHLSRVTRANHCQAVTCVASACTRSWFFNERSLCSESRRRKLRILSRVIQSPSPMYDVRDPFVILAPIATATGIHRKVSDDLDFCHFAKCFMSYSVGEKSMTLKVRFSISSNLEMCVRLHCGGFPFAS